MFRTLLVPLDGSRFGEHALPLALSLARQMKARLHLLHVHVPLAAVYTESLLFPDDSLNLALRQKAEKYLAELLTRLPTDEIEITTQVREGVIVPMVLAEAESVQAGAIVLATHARGAVDRFWLGSVADQLIHDSSRPLLLVRPIDTEPDLTRRYPLQRFLVPVDGTPFSTKVLDAACEVGTPFAASFTLVRVLEPIRAARVETKVADFDAEEANLLSRIESLHEQLRSETRTQLDATATYLRQHGCTVDTRIELAEHPEEAILELARPDRFDLVCLATHGRRGLSRLFYHSVTERVLRGCAIPVLVQRFAE